MNESNRIIQPERIQVQLINGSTISIRPLTLKERKECISIISKYEPLDDLKNMAGDMAEKYIQVQGDILHYVITRSHSEFKREDIDEQLDSTMIEKIFAKVFNDPFEDSESIGEQKRA